MILPRTDRIWGQCPLFFGHRKKNGSQTAPSLELIICLALICAQVLLWFFKCFCSKYRSQPEVYPCGKGWHEAAVLFNSHHAEWDISVPWALCQPLHGAASCSECRDQLMATVTTLPWVALLGLRWSGCASKHHCWVQAQRELGLDFVN